MTKMYCFSEEIPELSGKYIVKTTSDELKSERVLEADLSFNKEGKPVWSFSRQLFKSYLKEVTCL